MMSDIKADAKKLIRAAEPWAISMRRYLHKNPELSGMEFNTAAKIEEELRNMGIETVRTAETGVVGMIRGKKGGKVVAIRADIDALPLQEKTISDYSSIKDGVMHACGHDAHTAILLGTAKVLTGLKNDITGTIKLFFQPAEETTGGAERMISEGYMQNPNVDYVIGLHVMPQIETGKVELKYNKLNAASDMIKIRVFGKSAHGAYPESGTDAIVAASQIIINLQSVITRRISPLDQVVLSFGTMHGGSKGNIICDEVELKGILRTLDEKTRISVKSKIKETVEYTAKANGADASVEFEEGYKSLNNNNEVMDVIVDTAREVVGSEGIVMKEQPSLGVEDFSYFLDYAKGAFFHLGCGYPNTKNAPLHSDVFELNEDCISYGIMMETYTSLKLLEE